MNKYLFTNDSYYYQPSCDCCDGEEIEAYNMIEPTNLGSSHSVEDCYVQAIVTEAGDFCIGSTMHEILRGKSLDELQELAHLMKIEVLIV